MRTSYDNRAGRFGSSLYRRCAAALAGVVAAATMMAGAVAGTAVAAPADQTAPAANGIAAATAEGKHFMVYYRAWRDVTMKGVNTDLPDENWISMYDIPYGIDVVNVFSYVPSGQEAAAQPFYDKLKSDYAPYLHSRGIKLVRGLDYQGVMVNGFQTWIAEQGKTVATAVEADYDAYADHVIATYMTSVGLDGLDIDMETYPTEAQVAISDRVITSLAKRIGPKSADPQGTMFLYDTNGSYTAPFEHVADCFDYVAYQQYGSTSARTAKAAADYAPFIDTTKFVPGLTFPEEGDRVNRWYDATEPYLDSHMYDVASYSYRNNLGGMFIYALDRDGRTYEADDLNHIKPSNLIWTKTAIAESQGMSLADAKSAAAHFLDRMAYADAEGVDAARQAVEAGTTLYDVNKAVLGGDWDEGYANTYDPTLELQLTAIDTAALRSNVALAGELIADQTLSQTLRDGLSAAKDAAIGTLTGKLYTADEIAARNAALKAAIDAAKPAAPAVDTAALTGLVGTAKTLRQADYTAASWKPFAAALATAETVLADETADQSAVDAAAKALSDAMGALVKAPSGSDALASTGAASGIIAALALALMAAGMTALAVRRRRR